MKPTLAGIHHVTAIAGDPQANLDFYAGVLGLRLVKKTVNFNDPGSYHLYYGDAEGRPGTLLTFFPWPGAGRGRPRAGQATTTAFRVPASSLGFWRERLEARGIEAEEPADPVGELEVTADSEGEPPRERLVFRDPDGLRLALVGRGAAGAETGGEPAGAGSPAEAGGATGGSADAESSVPAEHAIVGLHGVTLTERDPDPTFALLRETLGFRPVGEGAGWRRLLAPGAGETAVGGQLVLVERPGAERGRVSVGTVHHVAFRTGAREEQEAWRGRLEAAGLRVTAIKDRHYFTSIYFREPGGVLFEIATDGPGFTRDEEPERLGRRLALPPWLEDRRGEIEGKLPRLSVPEPAVG